MVAGNGHFRHPRWTYPRAAGNRGRRGFAESHPGTIGSLGSNGIFARRVIRSTSGKARRLAVFVCPPSKCFRSRKLFKQGITIMNWDQIQGDWKQLTGKVKEKWGKLTDNDLTTIAGQRDQLAGVLQQRYGYAKEVVEKELDEFVRKLKQ